MRKQKIHESIKKKIKEKDAALQQSIAASISTELCNKQLSYQRSNFYGIARRKDPPEWMREKEEEVLSSASAKAPPPNPPPSQQINTTHHTSA
eukprot:CAMPEP_0171355488 /NCGR_PEP_ID=MMETSP0878-20121228/45241_1 /TAXON_ID=67004 /ORGANISM="Thalassiosira weissflogii, Strain CCMP1336" /LENGTH=92 /DNA_ID=CAMNT_0011861489 /DNA_START=2239 /DNA_END=2517 /DNA_ORIENTATION=+